MAVHRAAAAVLPSALAVAEERLAAAFASRGLPYPPRTVALVALKREARLELWADGGAGWTFVRSYLIRAGSGRLGPKLRRGDHQVPEGVYRVSALNPESHYHLALRLDYPNDFDRARAEDDGRDDLGGDIMIHGGAVSDGCLPVGDDAVEELFALTDRIGVDGVHVIVSPLDLRRARPATALARATERPVWLHDLYATIADALASYPLTPDAWAGTPRRARRTAPRCRPYDAADCVRRCRSGDVASCARAGLMFADGRGVARDVGRAWALLREACARGDALGCAELARLYLDDDGPRRDAVEAAALATRACDAGDGHGCLYLSRLFGDRIVYPVAGEPHPAARAAALLRVALAHLRTTCAGWNAYDCATRAALAYPDDPTTATRFARAACGSGDPAACYTLGRLAEDAGDGSGAVLRYAAACARAYAPACARAPASAAAVVVVAAPERAAAPPRHRVRRRVGRRRA